MEREVLGSDFWTNGYYVDTAGASKREAVIRKYVRIQGAEEEYE